MARIIAIAVAVALLATLAIGSVASGARPKCNGLYATKVGTSGNDYIKGTAGRDVIVARGGNDKIVSLGGNDVICAGSGKDLVKAGAGKDQVFGQYGNDILKGGDGWDLLNGGPGADKCVPGADGAKLVGCEGADLKVNVRAPASAVDDEDFTIDIGVKNVGAKGAWFDLVVSSDNVETVCVFEPNETLENLYLAPGAWYGHSYWYEGGCAYQGTSPHVTFNAEAETAVDDDLTNNSDEATVVIEPAPTAAP